MLNATRNGIGVVLLAALLAGSASGQSATNPPVVVSAADASTHLLERTDPTVPTLAKTLKVGGTVRLQLSISKSGNVTHARVLSGHPMLVQAAVDAAQKWHYKPFEVNGMPVEATAEVEITFPSGMSASESDARNKYFPVFDECQNLVKNSQLSEAEKKCREAVELSNQLPKDVILERTSALSLLANSIFLQHRYTEAIPIYQEALDMDRGYRKPDDADLASDYWNLGRALAMSGELKKADALYETAVRTFEAAITSLPDMKENYVRRLKRVLNELAQLKDAEGDHNSAGALRSRASAL